MLVTTELVIESFATGGTCVSYDFLMNSVNVSLKYCLVCCGEIALLTFVGSLCRMGDLSVTFESFGVYKSLSAYVTMKQTIFLPDGLFFSEASMFVQIELGFKAGFAFFTAIGPRRPVLAAYLDPFVPVSFEHVLFDNFWAVDKATDVALEFHKVCLA